MGYWIERTSQKPSLEFFQGLGYQLKDFALAKGRGYAVRENGFALVFFLELSPGEVMYSAVPEEHGPVAFDCPKKILRQLRPLPDTPEYEYARKWRARNTQ